MEIEHILKIVQEGLHDMRLFEKFRRRPVAAIQPEMLRNFLHNLEEALITLQQQIGDHIPSPIP